MDGKKEAAELTAAELSAYGVYRYEADDKPYYTFRKEYADYMNLKRLPSQNHTAGKF